jgi:hypothetical protein
MSSDFEAALGRELTAVGIHGRLRRRVLDEFADHMACDPDAALGDAAALARQFADELGTARALTAAVASFAALLVAGGLFAAAYFLSGTGAFGASPPGLPVMGPVVTLVALLAPQVSFVGGVSALLRWWRRRHAAVIPAAEATVIVRRAALGVGAGLAATVSLGVMAVIDRRHVSSGWMTLALTAAAVGTVALAAVLPTVWAAARLRPASGGLAGDVFDDLGGLVPRRLRGRPWRLAIVIAAGVALAITLNGVAASDPYDGAAQGIVDGLVCLLGFATLGRFLGLWSPRRHREGSV